MSTLDALVHDLLDRYDGDDRDPGDGGPGLLHRLDELGLRSVQARQAGGRATPGSRVPGSIEALRWYQQITHDAIVLDMELRASVYPQRWERALRAIPYGAETAGRVPQAASTVGRWHSTCCTVLGLQHPAVSMYGVTCLVCGQRTIKCRPDGDKPRAWCTNPACEDDDGQPARYDTARLYLLTTNITAREVS